MSDREFSECANCSNVTGGDRVYKCDNCGHIWCEACVPDECTCGSNFWDIISDLSQIGTIKETDGS